MAKGPRFSPRTAKAPLKAFDAESVSALLFKHAIKISDKENGDGADWLMLADAAQMLMFLALDKAQHDARTVPVLHDLQDAAYKRLAAGPGGTPAPAAPSSPAAGQATAWASPRPK